MGCVYICRNTIDGKCYVGKTVKTMRHRRNWHLATASRGEGWKFHRALRKHGFDAFAWDILVEANDPEELDREEREFIAAYSSKGPGGYNLTHGGDGVTGRAPEVMERIAAFHRGRKRSAQTRERLSAAAKGKKSRQGAVLSDDTKRQISASLAGRTLPDEVKAKIGAAFRGKAKSPEQRARMSAARKLWWDRKRQAVRNLRAAAEGRPAAEETPLLPLDATEAGAGLFDAADADPAGEVPR